MHATTVQSLAAALRGRRVALGWSQADTAAVAGTSRKFVSEVEAGKETVELGKVLSLADALGLEVTITLAVGESGVPVDPEVLRGEAPAASPTRSRSLEDLLDDYLHGDEA